MGILTEPEVGSYSLVSTLKKVVFPAPLGPIKPMRRLGFMVHVMLFNKFKSAMDDDFNTAQAASVIFDFIRDANKVITSNDKIDFDFFINVKGFLERTAVGVLGIMNFETNDNFASMELEHNLIQLLIELRSDAKKEKKYALADKIRDQLSGIGIELKDSKEGTTFKIVK